MRRSVITGASRGIGRAIAFRLASKGFHAFLQGRDEAALKQSCQLVEVNAGTATPILADFNDIKAVDSIVEAVGTEPLDLLVNNAGSACVKPFEQITLDEWEQSFKTNVTVPFLLTQKLLPLMERGSSIVNILSIAAKTGFPNWSAYSMSKFALEGWSQSIREELRERGIRVINIYPAATDTEIWNNVPGDWHRGKMMRPEEVAEAVYYAVLRPQSIIVENITIGGIGGKL
jgi:short-subunit dehydrogenase